MEKTASVTQAGFKNMFVDKMQQAGIPDHIAAIVAEELSAFTWDTLQCNIDVAKKHLELFIYRVEAMRNLQKQFFAGKRTVMNKSMRAESAVDTAIEKLLSELGYSIEEFKKKFEQKSMF